MRAVLFYPRIEDSFRASYPPLGIMSIATYLNANGHEAIICDRFFETDSVETVLKKHRPDVIGVSVISFAFIKDASDISKTAKSLGIPVIWGGIMPSTIPEETLRSGHVDYISFNEGEFTWLEMANAFIKAFRLTALTDLDICVTENISVPQTESSLTFRFFRKLTGLLSSPKIIFRLHTVTTKC